MHLCAVVCAGVSAFITNVILFAPTVSSTSDSELIRRTNKAIIKACENVNNATDQFDGQINTFTSFSGRASEYIMGEALGSFMNASNNLISQLIQGRIDIRRGEKGSITEFETERVKSLRQEYNSKVLKFSPNLIRLGELLGQKGVATSVARELQGQKYASKLFGETVIEKVPPTFKGLLIQLDDNNDNTFETLVRYFLQLDRMFPDSSLSSESFRGASGPKPQTTQLPASSLTTTSQWGALPSCPPLSDITDTIFCTT
jgi:hypothetical protein